MILDARLEPTATYCDRTFRWIPTIDREGVLVVRQWKHKGGAPEADVYAVEETTPPHCPERTFLVVNATDGGQPDAYEVAVRGGEAVRCSCKAAKCRVPVCKHRDALESIIQSGGL